MARPQDRILEEVVVTAQKREQSLQDVPIAVSAFSADQLRALGSNQLDQLTEFIPSVELFDDRGAGQPTWVIRGVGLADFNSNNTPTAAVYYDEFYLTSNVLGGIGLFDVDSVEVLKGPQGGLYGRNTSGGAVLVNSRRPTVEEESNGYLNVRYGRWGRYSLEGAVGAPLGSSAAFRIAAISEQGGGWQDSLATPQDDDHGNRDLSSIRAQLLWQPSTALDVLLKVEGGVDRSETTLAYSRALFDPSTGDFCAAARGGRESPSECVTLSNLTNLFILTPGDPGILPDQQSRDGKRVLSTPINQLDNKWTGTQLRLDLELDFATLVSITGYLDYTNEQDYDFDAQPLALFEEDGRAELELWSQELRLVSDGGKRLEWMLGVMYAEDTVREDRQGNLSDNLLVLPGVLQRGFEQETRSWATYVQGSYELAEGWRVNAAFRYTDEDRDYRNGFSEQIGVAVFFEDVSVETSLQENWSGDLGLEWRPSNDAMLYGKVTRGFKSGGFFGGIAASEETLQPYGEEVVYSWELGFKTDWVQQTLRLNGAIFFYDYEDVQGFTQEFSEISGTVITRLGSLGDAEHRGAEIELLWAPKSLTGLTLQLSGSWLDAEIVESDTISLDQSGASFPVEGLQRSFAPEWSAFALARYEWRIGGILAAAQLNYSWRDDIANDNSLVSNIDVAAFSHEAFGLLNGRLSLGDQESGWNLAFLANNILDEDYYTRTSGDDLLSYPSTPGRPFSWAVEATYQW
ncbi:MAG: TonB-dependent receptor [Pseudomonadota bacterium]